MEKFYAYVHAVEREKFLYFSLVYRRTTVIITAPADNKAQKDFLGYDWSNRKGNEGIQILRPGGELYCDEDRKAKGTIAGAIRDAYEDKVPHFTDTQSPYAVCARTADLLDFSRVTFNKAIRLSVEKKVEIESKYPLKILGELALIIAGQSPQSQFYNTVGNGLPFYQGKKDYGDKYLLAPTTWTTDVTKESTKEDILMSVRAPVGDINLNPYDKICIGRGLAAIRVNSKAVVQQYLYYCLRVNQKNITGHNGLGFASISVGEIKEIKIPVPPLSVQRQIIEECEKVDEEYRAANETVNAHGQKLEDVLDTMTIWKSGTADVTDVQSQYPLERLSSVCDINRSKAEIRDLSDSDSVSFIEMASLSNDGFIESKVDRPYGDVRRGGYTYFAEGDVIIAKITPCMENGKCAIAEGLTNGVGFGSSAKKINCCLVSCFCS